MEVRGDQVRLGVNAPRDVPVDRSEVYEAKRCERQAVEAGKPMSSALGARGD